MKKKTVYTPLPEEVLKVKKKEAKALVEAGSGENFGNGETEEKYQCLRCNASEDEFGAILMVKTRLKQKEDKDEQVKEEELTVNKEANRLNV